jgi:hypothetical protein
MEKKFRLIVKPYLGSEIRGDYEKCHDAKSLAGRLIHLDSVKWACVAGISGSVYFYINKENYKENLVLPSELAEIAENILYSRKIQSVEAF